MAMGQYMWIQGQDDFQEPEWHNAVTNVMIMLYNYTLSEERVGFIALAFSLTPIGGHLLRKDQFCEMLAKGSIVNEITEANMIDNKLRGKKEAISNQKPSPSYFKQPSPTHSDEFLVFFTDHNDSSNIVTQKHELLYHDPQSNLKSSSSSVAVFCNETISSECSKTSISSSESLSLGFFRSQCSKMLEQSSTSKSSNIISIASKERSLNDSLSVQSENLDLGNRKLLFLLNALEKHLEKKEERKSEVLYDDSDDSDFSSIVDDDFDDFSIKGIHPINENMSDDTKNNTRSSLNSCLMEDRSTNDQEKTTITDSVEEDCAEVFYVGSNKKLKLVENISAVQDLQAIEEISMSLQGTWYPRLFSAFEKYVEKTLCHH
eukprot:MONOS_12216.1-p1 / transcript=MONOS_12216.1 / gene=MONOS_12216 / organism=Monocercomonoides_exilis_PA203 / gene_product=unspecified product / transcript_product=unspecified product / location=Mono_scaffold00660:22768-23892(+) / protein_length=375 / sequence_SO=supercontig / SO=protein_coding / is_pseudo=false